MEKNGGSGISYFATLLESKEFWQQVEEKEGLERGDGSRANEFSNFVSSRLSSITTRPGIFGAIFPSSLSRAIEKDGKGSKVALVPPLMELHRWWLYTDTKPLALPARGNPMPRNRSSPSLFPGRSIRFKKKKIGILASIWFEEHTLASRKKKGRRVIIFIAVLERQRCKRASFKSNLARLPFKLPFV